MRALNVLIMVLFVQLIRRLFCFVLIGTASSLLSDASSAEFRTSLSLDMGDNGG